MISCFSWYYCYIDLSFFFINITHPLIPHPPVVYINHRIYVPKPKLFFVMYWMSSVSIFGPCFFFRIEIDDLDFLDLASKLEGITFWSKSNKVFEG